MTRPKFVAVDSSVLVSLFVPDVHAAAAAALFGGHNRPVLVSPLNDLEFRNALALRVHRGDLTAAHASRVAAAWERELASGAFLWRDAGAPVWERASSLARDHTPRLNCRSLDVWHVAFALEEKADVLWTFDERQRTLALAVGLQTNVERRRAGA